MAVGSPMKPDVPSADEYADERALFASLEVVDLEKLQRAVTAPYKNQVLLNANGECMRLAVFEGEYRWHCRPRTDELFLVLAGELHIEFEDRAEATLAPLHCLVVPAGTVYRTCAVGRTVNVTFEQQGTETVFVETPSNNSFKPTPLRGAA